MRGKPGLAEVQSMPGCLEPKLGGDTRQQRVLVLYGVAAPPAPGASDHATAFVPANERTSPFGSVSVPENGCS